MRNLQNIDVAHMHRLEVSWHCWHPVILGVFSLCYLDASSGSGSPFTIKLVTPFTAGRGIQLAAAECC